MEQRARSSAKVRLPNDASVRDVYADGNGLSLDGELPGNRKLARPIWVVVVQDDGEFIVSEPGYHVHGYGATLPEALADLRCALADAYDILLEDEARLVPQLREQLAFLRSVIVAA